MRKRHGAERNERFKKFIRDVYAFRVWSENERIAWLLRKRGWSIDTVAFREEFIDVFGGIYAARRRAAEIGGILQLWDDDPVALALAGRARRASFAAEH